MEKQTVLVVVDDNVKFLHTEATELANLIKEFNTFEEEFDEIELCDVLSDDTWNKIEGHTFSRREREHDCHAIGLGDEGIVANHLAIVHTKEGKIFFLEETDGLDEALEVVKSKLSDEDAISIRLYTLGLNWIWMEDLIVL